jgi:CHAD domain-containing protein
MAPRPQPDDQRTALLLEERAKRVFRELPGALAGHEEAVHQVRVAARRLRVALPLLARKGQGRRLKRALEVLRQLTREVGSGRDLDVATGLLEDHLAELRSGVSPEQRRLLARLRAARTRARSRVAEAVLDLDIVGLRRNLRRVLAKGAADATTVLARMVAVREEEGSALLRGFSQVGDRYLPLALHALRRRVRRLRYAAEVEDAVRGEGSRAPALWKRLQDGIGALHDHQLLVAWLAEQGRLARERGNAALARAAGSERRFFVAEGHRLHSAFLEGHPADLALRALEAMTRAASAGGGRAGRGAGSASSGS